MTEVQVFKKQGLYEGFKCSGHTGYAENGQDVLCAVLSALVGSCHLGLSKVLGLRVCFQIDEEKGFFALNLKDEDIALKDAQLLLTTFVESVKDVANNYKKFIKLKIIGG